MDCRKIFVFIGKIMYGLLDVYKRQVYSSGTADDGSVTETAFGKTYTRKTNDDSYTQSTDVYKRQDADGNAITVKDDAGNNVPYQVTYETVSYTHLDVYKRQIIGYALRQWKHIFKQR